MPTEDAFLQNLKQNPADRGQRLIFADWLEDQGDARGELIRLVDTLTQAIEVPERTVLEVRLRELLSQFVQPVGPYFTNSIGMSFAWIPAGTFLMGRPFTESERYEEIEAQHPVTIAKGFYLGISPVTQEQWERVMSTNPSWFTVEANLPVEMVSWEDCQRWIEKLSAVEGRQYRLPTDAEWEYACRAGTTSAYSFGDTITVAQGNYNAKTKKYMRKKDCGPGKTTPVCSFPCNGFGLFDMHGNVWEYCQDWFGDIFPERTPQRLYYEDKKVLRGGSWNDLPNTCRSAARSSIEADAWNNDIGFRVALSPGLSGSIKT